jgi:hypothetical protein
MKSFSSRILAVAVGLVFATGAVAAMTKEEHQQAKDRIAAEYKNDKAGCAAATANAKDICQAQAKGKENVAKAELEATYKPSEKHRYDLGVAKADAQLAVAKEKCDDQAGNAKDVCVKEAKAHHTAAKADAKKSMKIVAARKTAREETTEARTKSAEKVADASKDAAADKRAAELKLANTKCEALAGTVKDSCMADAKARYGKI